MDQLLLGGQSDGFTIHWGAVAVGLVIAAAPLRAIIRSFRAPTIVNERYRQRPVRVRATIEADHVLRELAELIDAVNTSVNLDPSLTAEDALQSVGYLDRLRRLSELYADYSDAARLARQIEIWITWQGRAGSLFLVGFAGLMFPASLRGALFPTWYFVVFGILAIAGATIWFFSFLQESGYSNRLAEVLSRYE